MAGAARPASHVRAPDADAVIIGLNAAIVSVAGETPQVLTVHRPIPPRFPLAVDALPYGPFAPQTHRTLDSGLRAWVEEQTGLSLGYVEQLYTFGDRGRHQSAPGEGPRIVSVGYLALTRAAAEDATPETRWRDWYAFFPWEDWREARPAIVDAIAPRLAAFAAAAPDAPARAQRRERAAMCFGLSGAAWDEEKVLERYELLYEAGLVAEAERDGRPAPADGPRPPGLGNAMAFDHRRILATGMGRLRGKMKYRPVVFELMPPTFTLLELQRTVEALSGVRLHKQNFRRLVEAQGLVEETGKLSTGTGGRPAMLFRFRRGVLSERPAPGVKMPGRRR